MTSRPHETPIAATPPPLTVRTKLAYGVGAVALGLKDNGFSYLLLLFYNQVVGLPAATVGLAIMIALVVDAIFDPIIGQVSDNLRSRWGRRHPFMYASALPIALSYLLLWNPPMSWSNEALFYYLIVVAVLIRTFLAMFEIPSSALAPELTVDYDDRTKLLSYRAAFNWYGALIMSLAVFQVFLRPDATHPVAQLNPSGYSDYGLVSAGLMFVVILLSALGTHNRIPYLRAPPPRRTSILQGFRDMLNAMANRALVPMLMAGIFNAMAYGLSVALSLYFNTFLWGFTAQQVSFFIMTQFLSSALAIAIATPLSARLGKRNATILAKVFVPLVGLAPIVLRLLDLFPANGHVLLLPIMLVTHMISVTAASVVAILHGSMIADVVEDHELKSGQRSEGVFVAANIFIAKATSGVGIFASSMLLLAVGFPDGAQPGSVDPTVIRNLALIYAPSLIVMHLCAIGSIMLYRITRESHARTVAALAERALSAAKPPDL